MNSDTRGRRRNLKLRGKSCAAPWMKAAAAACCWALPEIRFSSMEFR
jgi:hypothetical protein